MRCIAKINLDTHTHTHTHAHTHAHTHTHARTHTPHTHHIHTQTHTHTHGVLRPAVRRAGFFFTLATGPRRSLSLKLSDTKVYSPEILVRLGKHKTMVLGFCAGRVRGAHRQGAGGWSRGRRSQTVGADCLTVCHPRDRSSFEALIVDHRFWRCSWSHFASGAVVGAIAFDT